MKNAPINSVATMVLERKLGFRKEVGIVGVVSVSHIV